MNRDEQRDQKLKEFFRKDEIVSNNASKVFDNFINEINKQEKIEEKSSIQNAEEKINAKIYIFRKILTVAACLMVVFIGSNVYATHLGYENIFFMIKELYEGKEISDENEIFSDRDIIISYQSFYITDGIEMQINELQVKKNKAKLYLFVKEDEENILTPFKYKVYNENEELMCDEESGKKVGSLQYSEMLELDNYIENMSKLKLEVYSKQNILLKTITVNLDEKVLEAKSEANEIKQISQIELNEFLKEETFNFYQASEIKGKQVLILKLIDIAYNDSIYIVKYLYCLPTSKNLADGNVEELEMHINTLSFVIKNEKYELLKMDTPEVVELEKK